MEHATPPLVVIKDLIKSYHRGSQVIPVLNNITLAIAEGEFLALMGPSGSGKSTLLNLIAGLDKPDSGSIMIGGSVGLFLASFLQLITVSTMNCQTVAELAFSFTLTANIAGKSLAFTLVMELVTRFLDFLLCLF